MAKPKKDKKVAKRTQAMSFPQNLRKKGAEDNADEVSTGAWGFQPTGNLAAPCTPFNKGDDIKAGAVQLVLVPPKGAKGLPPGPAIRFCLGTQRPGIVVPVKSPRDAGRLAASFQACVRGKGDSPEACAAREAEGKGAVLAGVRRRRAAR